MSAPEDRLISDEIVDELQREAVAVLNQHECSDRMTWKLASGMMALIRDRRARQELAAIRHRDQNK